MVRWWSYRADQTHRRTFEVYAVLIGAVPLRANGTLVANGDVARSSSARPVSHVVYQADQTRTAGSELYAVAASGGVSVKLTPRPTRRGDRQFCASARTARGVVFEGTWSVRTCASSTVCHRERHPGEAQRPLVANGDGEMRV